MPSNPIATEELSIYFYPVRIEAQRSRKAPLANLSRRIAFASVSPDTSLLGLRFERILKRNITVKGSAFKPKSNFVNVVFDLIISFVLTALVSVSERL